MDSACRRAICAAIASIAALTGFAAPTHAALRYDTDYPAIPYSGVAVANRVADLQQRMDRGQARLEFKTPRGYLDSLLRALHIDASSQTLVYSKTSLQIDAINAATPRAIYFNDDTYVAWVQGDRMIEIVTMDAKLGAVFYTMPNHDPKHSMLERETSRCLTCHDTFSMTGGGVPQFRFTSTLVNRNGEVLLGQPGEETTDATPVAERWGGWFVTGRSSGQNRLGNILVNTARELSEARARPQPDADTLDHLLDVRPYLTNRSDVVALLVLEHQSYIHNLITRANFKSRTLIPKIEAGRAVDDTVTWESLSPRSQAAMRRLLEPLVRALLFVDAAKLNGEIASTSGFDKWFESQSPQDKQGRSLRELDLRTHVFKHRLSYLIYSPGFDGMPRCAQEFVFTRLAQILGGSDTSATFVDLSATERATILQILSDTKPAFNRLASRT